MAKTYKRGVLDDIRSAFKEAPPPPEADLDISGRQIVEEMYDDITQLIHSGHTFDQISEVLSGVDVHLSGRTIADYFRELTKERRKAERRAKRQANKGKPVDSPEQKMPTLKAVPSRQVVNAEIIDDGQ